MQYFTNIYEVIGELITDINQINNIETVSKAAAVAVLPVLKERIHERGEMPDKSAIGTYSEKYQALREKKYNRLEGDKVVLSLTNMLEGSYTLAADGNSYVIGVLGEENQKKITWLTEKYGDVWNLSEEEKNVAKIAAEDTSKNLFK